MTTFSAAPTLSPRCRSGHAGDLGLRGADEGTRTSLPKIRTAGHFTHGRCDHKRRRRRPFAAGTVGSRALRVGHERLFALGYGGIILEEQFGYNKAALSLLMGTALWSIYAGATGVALDGALNELAHHVSEVSEIVFFLIGAMTIVEAVDAHNGFELISDIGKRGKKQLFLPFPSSFFMSGILDNLTTTIVMASLPQEARARRGRAEDLRRARRHRRERRRHSTPIGVTTTMLWINGQITALPTMVSLFIPSVVSTIISTAIMAGQVEDKGAPEDKQLSGIGSEALPMKERFVQPEVVEGERRGAAWQTLSWPLASRDSSVPLKALTGLPPYLGMLSALGVMWVHRPLHAGEGREDNDELMVPAALRKIDTAGTLFFLGVLLSVASLESAGILQSIANFLDGTIGNNEPLLAGASASSALSSTMCRSSPHRWACTTSVPIPWTASSGSSSPTARAPAAVCSSSAGRRRGAHGSGEDQLRMVRQEGEHPCGCGYFAGIATYLAQQQIGGF